MDDLEPIVRRREVVELAAIDDLFVRGASWTGDGSARVEPARWRCRTMAIKRHDSRAARHEQQWPAEGRLPDEIATDRAADLKAIPGDDDVVQERRHLAVGDPLDA